MACLGLSMKVCFQRQIIYFVQEFKTDEFFCSKNTIFIKIMFWVKAVNLQRATPVILPSVHQQWIKARPVKSNVYWTNLALYIFGGIAKGHSTTSTDALALFFTCGRTRPRTHSQTRTSKGGAASSSKHSKGTGVIHLINVNRNEAISWKQFPCACLCSAPGTWEFFCPSIDHEASVIGQGTQCPQIADIWT